MSRKGYIFGIGLVVSVVVSLLFLSTTIYSNSSPQQLGTLQTAFYGSAQHVQEKTTFYDGIIKDASMNAVYTSAVLGGYWTESPCGDYFGLELWASKNPKHEYATCIPDYKKQMANMATLSSHILIEEVEEDVDYEFYVDGSDSLAFHAIALDPVQHTIEEGRWYADRPSSSIDTGVSDEVYVEMENILTQMNDVCGVVQNTRQSSAFDSCVENVLEEHEGYHRISGFSVPDEDDGVNTLKQYFRFMEGMNYDQCFISFQHPTIAPNEPALQQFNLIDGKTEYNGELYDFQIGIMSGGQIIPLPETMSVAYDAQKKSIVTRRGVEELREIGLYKFGNTVVFANDENIRQYSEYFSLLPCSYENRHVIVQHIGDEVYPLKGELNYVTSFLVDDTVAPTVDGLEVVDKEFDQGAVLIFWDHTTSFDLDSYMLNVDGEYIREIDLWSDIDFVHRTFSFKGDDLRETCTITQQPDSEFFDCEYMIDGRSMILQKGLYYFADDRKFMYVLDDVGDGAVSVTLTAQDDEGNSQELIATGRSIDDLPLKTSGYTLTPIIISADGSYLSLGVIPPVASYHYNGKPATGISGQYYFVPHVNLLQGTLDLSVKSPQSGLTVSFPGNTNTGVVHMLVPYDPSLDQYPIDPKRMNYLCQKVPGPLEKCS